jgi:prevent-host-death family protein
MVYNKNIIAIIEVEVMRVPSTKVQNNFGKYLKYVEVNEEIIVTKKGKDVARILPCENSSSAGIMEEAAEYKTKSGWVTYEEFLELVEASDQRFELIDGVVYNMASPSFMHQHIIHEVHGAFYIWFKGKKCVPLTAPFDVTFLKAEDNICVVQPDIIVMCDKESVDKEGRYKGIPTMVIEVLSPSTRSKDMLKKLDLYKQCGVSEYWIIDPLNEHILVYSLGNNDIINSKAYRMGADLYVISDCFNGLQVSLKDMFEG